MPVDSGLQPLLDAINNAMPMPTDLPTAELRAAIEQSAEKRRQLSETPPEVAAVTNHMVTVGQEEIPVRVYTPQGQGPFPAHMYFHTGGFWTGTIDQCDWWCRELCAGASCIVISVAYRLAPEYQFPVAPEDGYAALCWAVQNHTLLNIDVARVSVGGASAGGNLATVVAMMARDREGPTLCFQLLELPATDLLTMDHPSIQQYGEGYVLTRAALAHIRSLYLADPQQGQQPYASPLHAPDLTRLPPALVMTVEFDPLRDEGEAYARRLQEAGVPTRLKRWDGLFHTSEHLTRISPTARQFHAEAIRSLCDAYAVKNS
ncbi:MAG TPA: alpha/beta hydrolase [Ktedonobacteraceae bacterium]|jgi:acetyl esterase|nr:alpha/beta hydrolase [Ktedonobacteraceae bacterium]